MQVNFGFIHTYYLHLNRIAKFDIFEKLIKLLLIFNGLQWFFLIYMSKK